MSAQEDAEPELDRAEVLGVLVPACIARVYAEAPTFSSFANAFTIGKSPLRQACHDFQQLAEAGAEAGAMSAELVEIATRAFRLACDNKTSKLCDPALEGLRLLFATGLVAGATEGWAPRSRDDAYGQNGQNDDEPSSTDPSSPADGPSDVPKPDIERERALSSLIVSVAKCAEVNVSSTHVALTRCVLAAHESDGLVVRGEALAHLARCALHLAVAASTDRDRNASRRALVRVINETFARAGLMAEPAERGSVAKDDSRDEDSMKRDEDSMKRDEDSMKRDEDSMKRDADAMKRDEDVEPGSRESDALLLTLTLCAVAAKPLDGSNDEYKSHARVLAMDLVRLFFIFVWAISMTSCFVHRCVSCWRARPRRFGCGGGASAFGSRSASPCSGREPAGWIETERCGRSNARALRSRVRIPEGASGRTGQIRRWPRRSRLCERWRGRRLARW